MAGNPVVHVIDDDDAARDALAFLLRTDNFSVHAYEFREGVPWRIAGRRRGVRRHRCENA